VNYIFSFDTRCIIEEERMFFRRGVWNTVDGIIETSSLENADCFSELIDTLNNDNSIPEEKIHTLSENDKKMFQDLITNGYIVQLNSDYKQYIAGLFSGQNIQVASKLKQFTLITDNAGVKKIFEDNKTIYDYEYNALEEEIETLSDIDYLSKMDPIDLEKKKEQFATLFDGKPIVIILQKVNLPLLENINVLAWDLPLFIGLIDGPFMMFLSIKPGLTACWNCFEQRMRASIQDHLLYNKFKQVRFNNNANPIYNLHLTELVHMAIQEVVTWTEFEMGKFMGRAMYKFLPTNEVHFHEIHRISSCDACGFISKESAMKNNASLNRLIHEYDKAKSK
jgi:thiazole/oxazole-forming peptide maturase SagC family component